MLGLALIAGLMRNREGPPPPEHPLAVLAPANIVTAASLEPGAPARAVPPARLAVLRATLAALRSAHSMPAAPINWAGARQWRVTTRDGLAVSLQVIPAPPGALVRVTADPLPGAAPAASARARAIRALRLQARRLDAAAAHELLQP